MDAILAVRTILLADTVSGGVVSLIGTHPTTGLPAVFGGQLPKHYNPEPATAAEPDGDGIAITLLVKGGTTHSEMPTQEVDVQVRVWGGVNKDLEARTVYNRCFQVLHGLCNVMTGAAGQVKRILATTPGVDMVDPDTGWATILCAFNVMIMDDGSYPVNVPVSSIETAAQYTDAAIAAISDIDGNGNFS